MSDRIETERPSRPRSQPNGYETDRDRRFEDFLKIYGLATVETTALELGCSKNAAKKYLRRRVRNGHLRAYSLTRDGRLYFRFSPSRVYRLGLPEKTGKPFRGNQGLLKAYAGLLWCAGGEVLRPRLTPMRLDELYPGTFCSELRGAIYCIDRESGTNRLMLLRCDYGGVDPRRLLRKCLEDIRRRFGSTAFTDNLIRPGRFGITVLTVEPSKAERLRHLFSQPEFLDEVREMHAGETCDLRFRAEALPELRNIIGG